ncbi:MAG: 50S ribosomal protein L29 [Spirochaetales bacterium]|nr:50S ribosomal protein L29 [Spirochaetales bacterium]
MKAYKELSYNELVAERDKLRKELVNLRMQKVLGHLDNPMSIGNTKKNIARLNTRIHAIDIGIEKTNK